MDIAPTFANQVYQFQSKFINHLRSRATSPSPSLRFEDQLAESYAQDSWCSKDFFPLRAPQLEEHEPLAVLVTSSCGSTLRNRLESLSQDRNTGAEPPRPLNDLYALKKLLDQDWPTEASFDLNDFRNLSRQATPSKFSRPTSPILKDRTEAEERKVLLSCKAESPGNRARSVRFSHNQLVVVYKPSHE